MIEDIDVLLVTTRIDAASDAVADALKRTGVKFFRLNTEDLPIAAKSSCEFRPGARRLCWHSEDRVVSLDTVKCVWFRRHRLPRLPPDMIPAHSEYCLRESQWFLRGLLWNLTEQVPATNWMSPPADIQRAESKMFQLQVAGSVGLTCPETLIANNPEEIRAFFNRHEGRVVVKSLRLGYFDYGHVQTAAYTSVVSASDLARDEALRAAPVIYQSHLEKHLDIRVTIVGESIYTAAIHSQEAETARVDWRRTDEELEHKKHVLPDEIAKACRRLMKVLKLRFGAIDFVLTPDGQYVFLEINPNGQWLWIEDRLGYPITNRIAKWLRNRSMQRLAPV